MKYMTIGEYILLLKSDMFWEIYPEANGIYELDVKLMK